MPPNEPSPLRPRRGEPSVVQPKQATSNDLRNSKVIKQYIDRLPGKGKPAEVYKDTEIQYKLFDYSFVPIAAECQLNLCCTEDSSTQQTPPPCFVIDARIPYTRRGIRFVSCVQCTTLNFADIDTVQFLNRPTTYGILKSNLEQTIYEGKQLDPAQKLHREVPLGIGLGKSNGFITLIG